MNARNLINVYLLCLLTGMASSVAAENSTSSGGYTIHHNALKSDFLSPAIAKAYNIQRSKYRGLINISVIKDSPGTTGTPVKAKITIKALALSGIPKQITLYEIIEDKAIYYIGDFPVINREIVNFNLEIIPQGKHRPITARFTQQFYID
jgi:Domain of unknown function (DUF4426)